MEGFGEFNLVRESSEGNGNRRFVEEAFESGYGTNEFLEVTSSDTQEIDHDSSSTTRRGHKQRHTPYQIQELEK